MVGRRSLAIVAFLLIPTASSAQVSIRDLVDVVDLSGLSVSPDGRRLVFRAERGSLERNAGESVWYEVGTDGDRPAHAVGDGGMVLTTDAGVPIDGAAVWDRTSRWFFYRALVDGAIGLWRAAADGSDTNLVTHEDADILRLRSAPNGRHLLYDIGATRAAIAQAERKDYDAGTLVDATVDPAQAVYHGAIVDGRIATQRLAGKWFARRGLLGDTPGRTRSLDLTSLVTADATDDLAVKGQADAGRSSVMAVSTAGGLARLYGTGKDRTVGVLRQKGTTPELCHDVRCHERVVALLWGSNRNTVLLTTEDVAHDQTLVLWDLSSRQVRTIGHEAGLLSGSRDSDAPCVTAGMEVFCVAAGAGSPPQLVGYDLNTGVRRIVFDPNASLRRRTRYRIDRFDWQDASGQAFTGQLFRPAHPSSTPTPLFINYYRCEGFIRGGLGDEWPFATLAEAGITGLCINKPSEPDDGQDATHRYDQALSGVRSAIDKLVVTAGVDRSRVGMGGLSFGSEATMWVAVHSTLLRAVSIASDQLEPSYYWFNGVAGRDNHANLAAIWGLGAPDATAARWRTLSPALNVDLIRAPVLLQLPEQEARLTMELYARLSTSTTPAELYAFPDEPHIKIQPRHRLAVYQRNLDWFRFWLQDYVDPDPARAEQFDRWRRLAARQLPVSIQPRAQRSIEIRSKILK
ncbi:hypothetical protein BH09PSE3_BH09PSE3_15300 [soil metagenome]